MTIEAPISKFKKNGLLIYIVVALAASAYLAYDGYLNEDFKKKYTDEDGNPKGTLVFNQKGAPIGVGIAALLGVYFLVIRNKKLVADENELIIEGTRKIAYASIQKIDKTHFDSKGFFVLTNKDEGGKETECKISNRKYDNLSAVLDHLVEKIS